MAIQTMALVGTGVMGMGIAQIAAQSGVQVLLFDAREGAATTGKANLKQTLEKLQAKGKLSASDVEQTLQRLVVLDTIEQIKEADLVIEAIIENLEIKQKLFKQIESIVSKETILVSNTSSLSVTALAAACEYPNRIAGFHFFNPVPLMKIVEVIAGLATDEPVIAELLTFAKSMGHLGVRTKDTPGFIVNHAGRAYSTEGLKILSEGVTSVSEVDRILREGAGFRMGPLELFDLTALDVSHPVMESIYNQFYQDPRYRPNPLTRQMLSAGHVGRKVGQGFYKYVDAKKTNEEAAQAVPNIAIFDKVWIGSDLNQDAETLKNYLNQQGIELDDAEEPSKESLCILATYGEDTTTAALRFGLNAQHVVAIDMLTDFARHRTVMPSLITEQHYIDQAHAIFAKDQTGVSVINESVGFVAQRTLAMIINLACDIAQQQIATASDIDQAVKLGLGYPFGPLSWGDHLGADRILLILERISAITLDPRYRPSPWLQRRAALGLSLLFSKNNAVNHNTTQA
ncbi:3-hydroxyacyl-CoA dehydrogenase [Acinetobacter gerneri]|jgi:3-hydroxybutyryl-CoA dehydrogenase|uniref:3-hydroxyacyl-CoA dehydrogenase n=1 Tax=Acinetobacter gerneri TaxID=202952 RepID=UPI0023F544D7|nr:3-hydroxyacyl-CoA dehydrogenase [Acinetobacter gerneri]MCH4244002.1 3-hydroxyacyl-CoA dehydrogenase [Acinetobacter gerneri]